MAAVAAGTIPSRLGRLFAAFDESGLEWSLLRPAGQLAQRAGDVDVLVSPGGLARAGAVLEAEGFLPIRATPGDVHAADHDAASGRFLWIHVQTALHVAELAIGAGEVLAVARARPLPQPPDGWLFWILALRGLLEKGGIPARQRSEVQALAASAAAAPSALRRLASGHGIDPERIVALAAAGDWDGLERLASVRAPRRERRRSRLRSRLAGLRAGRGLTVAVLGPDGAGKSTLVDGLERSLPLPTRVQYLGLTGGWLPRADALRMPGLVFTARVAILWSRYLRGAYHRAHGRVVLFDRYTLDAAVPSGRRLRPVAAFSRRVQRHVIPKPDLVLVLDAPGAVMHARKGEYEPERLDDWAAAYRRLAGTIRHVEMLDASRPAEIVLADAEARVWRRYGALWHGR
ncbi:MAG: hypothetical protein QOK21_2824 [Solirubrobacteraceae bacterium]|nr:hypothetical protein [Solirubrobacteraceae bacterium]